MIGKFLRGTRDIVQSVILLLVLLVLLKLFSLPDMAEVQDWIDYRRAIANIEQKSSSVESFVWRGGLSRDKQKAINLLCRLAKKGKEEAELLLLIYDKGVKDCLDN